MDVDIRTTTPNGSPLLAYGTASSFPGPGGWLRYAAIAAVVLLILGGTVLAVTAKLQVPQNPLLIAVIPGHTALSDKLPEIWRKETAQTALPILIGASVRDGKLIPFAVTLGLRKTFTLHIDEAGVQTQAWAATDLLGHLLSRTKGHLLVRPSALGLPLSDIAGDLTANGWETTLSVPAPSGPLPPGDVAIDISSMPEAAEPIEHALEGIGYGLPSDLPQPKSLAWQWSSSTANGLRLDFASPVASSTSAMLERIAVPTTRAYTLQDGTLMQEYIDEGSSISSSTAYGAWQADGLAWQSPDFDGSRSHDGSCPQGAPILRLDERALTHISRSTSLFIPFTRLEAASLKGKLLICASF